MSRWRRKRLKSERRRCSRRGAKSVQIKRYEKLGVRSVIMRNVTGKMKMWTRLWRLWSFGKGKEKVRSTIRLGEAARTRRGSRIGTWPLWVVQYRQKWPKWSVLTSVFKRIEEKPILQAPVYFCAIANWEVSVCPFAGLLRAYQRLAGFYEPHTCMESLWTSLRFCLQGSQMRSEREALRTFWIPWPRGLNKFFFFHVTWGEEDRFLFLLLHEKLIRNVTPWTLYPWK